MESLKCCSILTTAKRTKPENCWLKADTALEHCTQEIFWHMHNSCKPNCHYEMKESAVQWLISDLKLYSSKWLWKWRMPVLIRCTCLALPWKLFWKCTVVAACLWQYITSDFTSPAEKERSAGMKNLSLGQKNFSGFLTHREEWVLLSVAKSAPALQVSPREKGFSISCASSHGGICLCPFYRFAFMFLPCWMRGSLSGQFVHAHLLFFMFCSSWSGRGWPWTEVQHIS